jgi:subtilase family serine protease
MAKKSPQQKKRSSSFGLENLEGRALMSASLFSKAEVGHNWRAQRAQPTFRAAHLSGVKPFASAGATGLTPAQMRHAYGVDSINFNGIIGDGAGQTIAIVDAYDDPTAASDLSAFDRAFGLADPPSFTKLNQTGGTALPSVDPAGRGNSWALEESLDIEWAHAIAPQANIILYEANSSSYNDLITAAVNTARNNPNVTAISMSFGGGEFSSQTSLDSYFTTPAGHSGVTFVASTGDSGAPGGYPSYSPNVIAVGGTTLSVDASGNYLGETGWSNGGGGVSAYEAEPSYQSAFQSTGKRTIPDVAMDADPNSGVAVYDSYDNGASTPWVQLGGTSLSAPMFAGIISIANQGRVQNGLGTLDGRGQALPAIYQASASNFHDVTSGNNGGYSATAGYDEVTGRGSPVANLLVSALAGSSGTTITLSAPSSLTARAVASTQVNLTWSNSNASGVTANVVQRSSNGGSTWTTLANVSATATSYTDSTASAGATYSYRVYATNGSVNSSNSNVATVTTIPAAPQNVAATAASASQINLTWSNVTGATGFRVDRSLDGATWSTLATLGAGVTSYANTGLAASTTYYYRVLATNSSGTSTASATASAKTVAATTTSIPNAASNFMAWSTSNTTAQLSWQDNSNNETGFKVSYSLDGVHWYFLGTTGANVTSVQVSGLSYGTRYYFRVNATNAAGDSAASNSDWVQAPYY